MRSDGLWDSFALPFAAVLTGAEGSGGASGASTAAAVGPLGGEYRSGDDPLAGRRDSSAIA